MRVRGQPEHWTAVVTILSTCPQQKINKQADKKKISSDVVSVFTLTVGNNHMKLMSAITLRLLNEKEYLRKS